MFTRASARPYYLNQSILIDDKDKAAWTYEKTYPVVPGEATVTPRGPGSLAIAETAIGRIATAICNDFHFPSLIRQAGRAHANIVMAPYNSASPFEQQDATVAVMRAVENGASMVRATGNGVSLIIDHQGRILGSQSYGEGGGVMIADLPTHGVATIYSRISNPSPIFAPRAWPFSPASRCAGAADGSARPRPAKRSIALRRRTGGTGRLIRAENRASTANTRENAEPSRAPSGNAATIGD